MSNPEEVEPQKQKIFTWKVVLGIVVILVLIGQFTGGTKSNEPTYSTSTSSSTSTQKADVGTHMACEHWRINLSNASVETFAQQLAGAQKINSYARVSTNPTIVEYGRKMVEDMLNNDPEAYLADGTVFGNACQSAGE